MANPNPSKTPAVRTRKVGIQKVTATYQFSGPLPHPQVLSKYEDVTPGAADRIIAMAEKQAQHRQELEAKIVTSNVQNERIGMYFAFALTLIIMGLGTYLLMNDKPVEGFIAFFAPGLFQAGNYIYNKYAERRHMEESDATQRKQK